MICGNEFRINFKKIRVGSPLLTISSISCTLLAKEKTAIIRTKIKSELLKSCLKIYLSTKFIDF